MNRVSVSITNFSIEWDDRVASAKIRGVKVQAVVVVVGKAGGA